MTKRAKASPGPAQDRSRLKWPLWAASALFVHFVLVLALWVVFEPGQSVPIRDELLSVSLFETRTAPKEEDRPVSKRTPALEERAEAIGETPSPELPVAVAPPKPGEKQRKRALPVEPEDTDEAAGQDRAELVSSDRRDDGAPDLSKINLKPNPEILYQVASEDPRIRRMLDKREAGPFGRAKQPRTTNLPAELKHEEINRVMEVHWKPSWSQMKHLPWVKNGLKEWLQSWQKKAIRGQGKEEVYASLLEQEMTAQYADDAASLVSVVIDVEPLQDGTWTASIARPSSHPFFDRQALADVKQAAKSFDPWPQGYGNALRYRLCAKFIVVPPSPSTLIGASCAFPFCTPEEFKELEIYYWFKKSIRKYIYFEGLVEPPPP